MSDDVSSSAPSGPPEPRDDDSSLAHLLMTWLRGGSRARSDDPTLRESLSELIREHADSEQPIDAEERLMLSNILKLHQLRADDVMVPRADIVAVEVASSLDAVVQIMREAFHSRLPVYRDTLDDVVGFVHIKDVLEYWDDRSRFALDAVVHKLLFVPPTMSVLDLLMRMRVARVHMALVIDEFGGTDGLITIEDLVEQIVGDIEDEHDQLEEPMVIEEDDGSLIADARVEVEAFEDRVGLSLLPEELEEDVDTLGGLVFSLVGRVPQRGELIVHPSGIEFEVVDADPRRIRRLRVRGVPRREPEASSADGDGGSGAA
jgi:magnesium and cobalt transporter